MSTGHVARVVENVDDIYSVQSRYYNFRYAFVVIKLLHLWQIQSGLYGSMDLPNQRKECIKIRIYKKW